MIRNFLFVFSKFGATFLFVALEILCFYLLITFNQSQKKIWVNSANIFSASVYNRYDKFTSFMDLKEQNEILAKENAQLRLKKQQVEASSMFVDSTIAANFQYIPALVINNSVSKTNNYITLNKGKRDGIEKGMGVISMDGVVGIVSRVNKKYCLVNSLLNQQTRISAMLKSNQSIGNVTWRGTSPLYVNMESLPQYVEVIEGDTVVTSGLSTVFPKGHMIGQVKHIDNVKNTGFYNIDVVLESDMSALKHVYIIKNPLYKEIKEFENEAINE